MSSSPYAKTPVKTFFQDKLVIRPVPAYPDDPIYTIEPQYTHRPDLLAYDMYGDTKLWWVFAQRNMDIIEDPVYDLEPGVTIYLPQADKLKEVLGD